MSGQGVARQPAVAARSLNIVGKVLPIDGGQPAVMVPKLPVV